MTSDERANPKPSSGIRHHPLASLILLWWDKLVNNPNGGDFRSRSDLALRHAVGTCAYFSLMVFTRQTLFLSFWVGNIYVQLVVLCRTVGAAVPFALGAMRDLTLVTFLTWAINEVLKRLGTAAFATLIPIVAGLMSFAILLCPQIEGRVLAQVVMILILPIDLYAEGDPLYPLRLAGGCGVGALVGLAALALPLPRQAMAARTAGSVLRDVQKNVEALLGGIQSFSLAAASVSDPAGQHLAVSSIERAVARLDRSCAQLAEHAGAADLERRLFPCRRRRSSNDAITNWSTFLVQQKTNLDNIRVAATQKLDFTTQSHPVVREVNVALTTMLKDEVSDLASTIIAAMEVGIRSHGLDCDGQPGMGDDDAPPGEHGEKLRAAVRGFREAWKAALPKVHSLLISGQRRDEQPQLAFILRRLKVSRGLALFCDDLAAFLETGNAQHPPKKEKCRERATAFVLEPWPQVSWDNYLVPFKAGFGLAIASLWISIPRLNQMASPFATFPAITVACVQTGLQGSSYLKCVDRLWATLSAVAFALLLSFVADNAYITANQIVNIVGVTFFTFFIMYLRDGDRPYRQDYAAQSIGFILYGSSGTNHHLPEYVTLRIVLILFGIIIFVVVEFFVWPRSSRRIVQEQSLIFLRDTNECLHEALLAMRSMAIYTPVHNDFKEPSCKDGENRVGRNGDTLSSRQKEMDEMSEGHARARHTVDVQQTEIFGALNEPVLGFSMPMKKSPWVGIVRNESECEAQLRLLLGEVQSLRELFAEDTEQDYYILQRLDWPSSVADMIELAAKQLGKCNHLLKSAFPDGRIRQQRGNSLEAVKASSCFRGFDYVGERILEIWSMQYYHWIQIKENLMESAAPNEAPAPLSLIVSQCMTTSILLEVCHHLQSTGRYLEIIAREFNDA